MKYLDEFRDSKLVSTISDRISEAVDPDRRYRFMEVCGTHTMAIFKYGIKTNLASNIELISGPGCPVCVTEDGYIDKAVNLGERKDVIIATFGDMLKVPGSRSSLEKEKSKGADVRVVYSTMDALEIARKNPREKIVFLGIGFETTAPTVAGSILEAEKTRTKNFFVLCGHKTMPHALRALLACGQRAIDGFILPAHVSTIIGSGPYKFIAQDFGLPCVIAGFEPVDILQGINMLITQIREKKARVQIQYDRIAREKGNTIAQKAINRVFEETDAQWRGIGCIKKSGLKIRKEFSKFDAESAFKIRLKKTKSKNKGCICGEVLRGIKRPVDCKLYKKKCSPDEPIGPCMVSSEGTCAAYYRYGE